MYGCFNYLEIDNIYLNIILLYGDILLKSLIRATFNHYENRRTYPLYQ